MKKYIKTIVAVALLFCATSIAKAHPTNISSIMLIEQEPGEWIVQVNTSLTAFQYEIRHAFGENSYASPEEFNELVVKHFRKHMSVKINGEKVELTDGVVVLGHATTLGFRLSGIPESGINDISVKNEGFKNIGKSKSIFSKY